MGVRRSAIELTLRGARMQRRGRSCRRTRNRAIGAMTRDAEFVAIRITKIGAVVMLVVFGPRPRRAFARAAAGQRGSVGSADGFAIASRERNHLPVAGMVTLAIEGVANHEVRPAAARAVPTGPRSCGITPSKLEPRSARAKPTRGLQPGPMASMRRISSSRSSPCRNSRRVSCSSSGAMPNKAWCFAAGSTAKCCRPLPGASCRSPVCGIAQRRASRAQPVPGT